MENAFQELDYSDISAKNINKTPQMGLLTTKSRGGWIRLIFVAIVGVILLILGFNIYGKYSQLSTLKAEHSKYWEQKTSAITERNAVIDEYTSQKKENQKMKDAIKTLTEQNKLTEEEIKKYTDMNTVWKGDIKKLEQDYKEYKTKIDQLTQENKSITDEIASRKWSIEELKKKISDLKDM